MSVDSDRGLPEGDPGLSEEDAELSEEDREPAGMARVYHVVLASLFLLLALQPYADVAEGVLVQLGLAGLLLAGLATVAFKRRLFVIGRVLGVHLQVRQGVVVPVEGNVLEW